jgi:hypothetical protein
LAGPKAGFEQALDQQKLVDGLARIGGPAIGRYCHRRKAKALAPLSQLILSKPGFTLDIGN